MRRGFQQSQNRGNHMKFCKAFLVLSLFLAYASTCFAINVDISELDVNSFLNSSKVIDNKVYLDPETISITSNQILLNTGHCVLPIANLSVDTEGVFITIEEMVMAAKKESWKCRWCQRVNSMEDRWCARCGRSWSE